MIAPEVKHFSVFAHIVTFNSAPWVQLCLEAVLAQEGFRVGENLHIRVTDNASSDDTVEIVRRMFDGTVALTAGQTNLGFCGGHNAGLGEFAESNFAWFLVLNPDVRLHPSALQRMIEAGSTSDSVGSVCPKLFRSDDRLEPFEPKVIDSAGIIVTPDLRHLDRGAESPDSAVYERPASVFGGSGACLLLKKEFVTDAAMKLPARADEAVFVEYPQLRTDWSKRVQLFDESFFAYREDADLAWRGQILGWSTIFCPHAHGYHKRRVTPERRSELPTEINRLGVRNRFLLQLNNLPLRGLTLSILIRGVILRNLLVIAAVVVKERSSLTAFRDLFRFARRARRHRAQLFRRSGADPVKALRWFRNGEYIE